MLAPLVHTFAFWGIAVIAAAIALLYAVASRRALPGAGIALRVLAVAALVVPAWTLVSWYRDLSLAREAATRMAIRTEAVMGAVAVNAAVLLCLGFLVMIGGIWLARRIP